ncbi:hypothetical protein ACFC4G_48140 [Streptomyces sp. NPDC056002]|uniref:hypothetical protein n=1 Tax=Streptomyces sp. NPDC056002 TaxID=3345675 RepID=UPI0035E33849
MRLRTLFRTSATVRVAPFAIALCLYLYFPSNQNQVLRTVPYAPALVHQAIGVTAPYIYATVAGLGVWQMGQAKKSGLFDYPLVRRQFRMAAQLALPTVMLGVVMLVLPIACALAETGIAPTVDSLWIPAHRLFLVCCYLLLGMAVGYWFPPLIAAPLLAAAVHLLVSFSVGLEPFWLRNVAGQFDLLMYGELPTWQAFVAPMLWASALACAATLTWMFRNRPRAAVAAALVIATTGTFTAQRMVRDFGATNPVVSARGSTTCTSDVPRICVPSYAAPSLGKLTRMSRSVLDDLRENGITASPSEIRSAELDGRRSRPSTHATWRLPLTGPMSPRAHYERVLRYKLSLLSVSLPCEQPDPVAGNKAALFAASTAGAGEQFEGALRSWSRAGEGRGPVVKEIKRDAQAALRLPAGQRKTWYQDTVNSACS